MSAPFHDSRRRSSFSGPTFAPSSFAHSDSGFRSNRDGYNDMYNGFQQEVSGPPNYPPPGMGPGMGPGRGPPFPNSSMPNAPPPPPMSGPPPLSSLPPPPQPFAGAGGPGSFPSAGMGPMTREPHLFQHDSPGFDPMGMPPHSAPYPNSFDGSPLTDQIPPPFMDDGGYAGRGRTLSTGGGGFGPPALIGGAGPMPMTPFPSHHSGKRMRRASSVGPMGLGVGFSPDSHQIMGGRPPIKFRLSGATHSGISVADAIDRVTVSQSRPYLIQEVSPDMYGKITLKVRWTGYHSNTYSIPLSRGYQGYLDLQSLARRSARAIVHFMQANNIFLSWERVVIHRLEEVRPGIWLPVLTTH
jgi:hypothetical protein